MSSNNIPFSIQKKKITLNYLTFETEILFQETQERVRNGRGKQAISVRATEVLLYMVLIQRFKMEILWFKVL